MGRGLPTACGHIHDYSYWRRAKNGYSRVGASARKMMALVEFEGAIGYRYACFTRVARVRLLGVGAEWGVSEFGIEPVKRLVERTTDG